jgi:hypothetical protein
MSKVKFNPNDPKQVGSLGLHIMGINDMPEDRWLSYFTDDGMKRFSLNDEQGFIGRLPPHLQDKARDLLSSGVEDTLNNMVDRTDTLIAMSKSPTASASVALVGSVVNGTVTTDKGVFTSTESLKVKLSGVYSIQDFDKVWVEALTLAKIDADVEYISNPSKKVLLSSIKSAILSAVEDTVNNI